MANKLKKEKKDKAAKGKEFEMVPNLNFIMNLSDGQSPADYSFKKDDQKKHSDSYWLFSAENRKYQPCFSCHNPYELAKFNPHLNQLDESSYKVNREICLYCHYRSPKAEAEKEQDFKLKYPLLVICTGCHPGKSRKHPGKTTHSGKKMTTGTSGNLDRYLSKNTGFFPLAEKNIIVCSTCHNPHDSRATSLTKTKIGANKTYRLRMEGSGICPICHVSQTKQSKFPERAPLIPDLEKLKKENIIMIPAEKPGKDENE